MSSHARLLLAAPVILLVALPGSADLVVTESEVGGDFANSFAGRDLLPPGTRQARGGVSCDLFTGGPDCSDWFAFVGLAPGTTLSLNFEAIFGDAGTVFQYFDSSQTQLGGLGVPRYESFDANPGNRFVTLTVPSDGELVVRALPGQDSASYSVTLVKSPEVGDVFLSASGSLPDVEQLDPATGDLIGLQTNVVSGLNDLSTGANGDAAWNTFGETFFRRLTGSGDVFDSFDPGALGSNLASRALAVAEDGTLVFSASPVSSGQPEDLYTWDPTSSAAPLMLSAGGADDLAMTPGGALFALTGGVLEQIDRSSGARTAIASGGSLAAATSIVAESESRVWVLGDAAGVASVDVASGVQTVELPGAPYDRAHHAAIDENGLLLIGIDAPAGTTDGELVRFDPNSGSVTPQVVGRSIGRFFALEVIRCKDGVGSCFPDQDGDGIADDVDNCVAVPNGPNQAGNQYDADVDGIGNACDGDFNQDGVVDGFDFSALASCFGQSVPGSGSAQDPTCGESDMNGDGVVGIPDFAIFAGQFGGGVGPSGLACADPSGATAPCLDLMGLGDTENDEVANGSDNCVLDSNGPSESDQLDADADGFGNACDGDFDQDGLVGGIDFSIFVSCIGQAVPGSGGPEDPTCEESDMNGDSLVGLPDFQHFLTSFQRGEPGPSGLACADPGLQPPDTCP